MHFAQDQLDAAFGAGIKQGTQQGQLSTRLSDVKNIMSSFGIDFEKAAETLKLDKAEKDIILEVLSKEDN